MQSRLCAEILFFSWHSIKNMITLVSKRRDREFPDQVFYRERTGGESMQDGFWIVALERIPWILSRGVRERPL